MPSVSIDPSSFPTLIEFATTSAIWAVIGLAALITFGQTRVAGWPVGLPAILLTALASSVLTAYWFDELLSAIVLFALLLIPIVLLQPRLRPMRWPARLFLVSTATATMAFGAALFALTFSTHAPLLGIGLSVLLVVLEAGALLLGLAFVYEIAEAVGRTRAEPIAPGSASTYTPKVCLQVPAFNEPPDLLRQTLEALSHLDYPNYVVQVVVNNTTNPALWMPVEDQCRRLGPRFQFIHLPVWPGFKAGALNEATRRLDPDVEIVGIVDADYVVQPDFLRECVPHLADVRVAFVQTPQHYREWRDSAYLRGLFYAYRYFFDVTMVARARVDAIIFCGTMGLIRVGALKDIGGWAEWCITEDAEASLRLLARGWKSVYLRRTFGSGLMPLDFDGLRRQRFRWAFGGVHILRRHFGLLLGTTPSKLTLAQRYHYLLGGLGWFADAFGVGLAVFLLLASPFLILGHPLLIRQLVGVVLVLPLFLLVSGLVRLLWSTHAVAGASWRDAPLAAMVMLALSLTVARACLSGLVVNRGVFLRTPKVRTPFRLGRAVLGTVPESAVAITCANLAVLMVVFVPTGLGLACAALLAWQVVAWGSAPAAALLAQGIALTPSRATFKLSPQTTGARPAILGDRPRRLAVAVVVVAAAIVLTPAIATSPTVDSDLQQALAAVPSPRPILPSPRPSTVSSTPAAAKLTPSAASSPTGRATPGASPSPGPPTASPIASALPSAAATPSHPVPSPSPRGTVPPTPTPRP
jgi:cellulose synthase/poly-beta-1,6-N-acetylglucosamine synthase-like glycosyltransferase